jgi:hypothetical protein
MAFQIPINSHNFTGLHAGDAAATTWIQTNHWDTSYDGLGTPQESAWYWDTVTGFEKVWDGAMWVVRGAVSGTTLDMAYDGGGAGLGRSITADSGAVDISVPIAVNGTALAVHQLNPAATVDVFTVENLGASGASIGLTGTRRWIESDAGDATFGLVANDANTYTLHLSAVNTGAGIAKIGIGADDDVDITSDTGCVTIHGYDTGTVGVEIEAVAGGGSVNIGAVNLPNQLNLGTGGIRTVVLGSVTGAAITTLRSGTGAFTVTAGGTFDVNVTGAVTIDAAGASGITIGGDANTGAIGVGNSASARSVTVGSTNTTSALALQAGTGFISFADGYKAAGGYAGALYLALNAAEYTSFEANFGEVSLLNAINQCATSAVTLDEAYNASGGASAITVDAGDVTWALTGAYSFVVDLTAATGTADGFHVEDGTDYFRLNHTAANSLALSSEFTSVGINTSEGVTIRANHASEFRVTSNNLTLSTVTSGTLAVTSAAVLDLDGVAVTLDASGGFSIDGSGAACNVSATSQDLTLSTITAGTLAVSSAALLTLSDGYKAGSTYATDLVLSDNLGEWSAFDTAFGEVSLLNAVAGLKDGNAATVTVADTASATCYVGLYEAASGSLAGKTDTALTYNASTGALAATTFNAASGGSFTINSLRAVKNPATGTWLLAGGGNTTLTGEYDIVAGSGAGAALTSGGFNVFIGGAAGAAALTTASSVFVGQDSGSSVTGQSLISALGNASLKNITTGSSTSALGANAGRYYGAETGALTSATQCVYFGASSRASADAVTNEIVIGYNAIGAGSNTATLGNTSIVQTQLRGNFGTLVTYGTSAAGVHGLASGTAPTTSPADAVQMWSGDFNAAAGKAALHLRDESGILSVFGNNWGLFTAGGEVIDATAEKTIFLSNGTAPSAHTDDGIYIHSLNCGAYDSADDLASLALCTESAVITASKAQDSALAITINGHSYWMLLRACEAA